MIDKHLKIFQVLFIFLCVFLSQSDEEPFYFFRNSLGEQPLYFLKNREKA